MIGKRAVVGNGRDASARSETLGETGAAAVASRLPETTASGCNRTLVQARGKEILGRRLLPRVTVVLGRRLDFAPRGLRIVEVVDGSRVAGLANSDSNEGAVAGGVGRPNRKAGTQPKGTQQEPPRQAWGRGHAGHTARRRHRAQCGGRAGHKARRRHRFRSISAGRPSRNSKVDGNRSQRRSAGSTVRPSSPRHPRDSLDDVAARPSPRKRKRIRLRGRLAGWLAGRLDHRCKPGHAGHKARRRHRAQGRGHAGHRARRRLSCRSFSFC